MLCLWPGVICIAVCADPWDLVAEVALVGLLVESCPDSESIYRIANCNEGDRLAHNQALPFMDVGRSLFPSSLASYRG